MKPKFIAILSLRWITLVLLLGAILCAAGASAGEIPAPFEYQVLGWSDDSTRWGFEENGDYGAGMVFSPGSGVYVIDAVSNRFVYKRFGHTADSAAARGADWARRTADARARRHLAKARALGLHGTPGTVVYRRPKMAWVDYDSQFRQFGDKRFTFDHAGNRYELWLQDDFIPDRESMAGTRSRFSVSIRRDDGPWHVLQADRSHWRPYLAYDILYVSISPDAEKVGILIEAVENGPEAQKQARYKGVTGLLP